jgi:hypothetical protein
MKFQESYKKYVMCVKNIPQPTSEVELKEFFSVDEVLSVEFCRNKEYVFVYFNNENTFKYWMNKKEIVLNFIYLIFLIFIV